MRVYWEIAKRAFQQMTTYRAATVAGIVTNTVFGFIYAFVLRAVYQSVDGQIDGFTEVHTVTYVFVAQGFLMVVGGFRAGEISERVQTGDVVIDLYRPVDFQAYWLSRDLGKALFFGIFRGVPPVLVGGLVLELSFPSSPLRWMLFGIAAILAAALAASYRFIADMVSFWIFDVRGVVQMFVLVQLFFQGSIIPLYFLPDGFEGAVRLLPFAQLVQHPVEVLLGLGMGENPLEIFGLQIAWLVALLLVGRMILMRATRRVVVQGG